MNECAYNKSILSSTYIIKAKLEPDVQKITNSLIEAKETVDIYKRCDDKECILFLPFGFSVPHKKLFCKTFSFVSVQRNLSFGSCVCVHNRIDNASLIVTRA